MEEVIIMYRYYSYRDKCVKEAERTFNDRVMALRFIYSIKRRKDYFLDGWKTYDNYIDEWLGARVSLWDINYNKELSQK